MDDIARMARELALAVGDPPPALDTARLISDGFRADPWFECYVAESEGTLIGYALVCRGFEAPDRRRLWMGDLYVKAAARKAGVGRALMAAVAARAVELGCGAVYWELWRPNTNGRAFYDRLGAEEASDLALMRIAGDALTAMTKDRRDE